MNVYLRRFLAMQPRTRAECRRAGMLAKIATEPRRRAVIMQQAITERWLLDLQSRVEALEDDRGVRGLKDRVRRLEAIITRRRDGWWEWERDARIDAFVRNAVAELRKQGFEDREVTVILGVSPADLRKLPSAA